MNHPRRIVIIGGVAAGAKTAAKARRQDPPAEIAIYTEEEYISYAGCGEPYYIGDEVQERQKLLQRTPQGFLDDYAIAVHPLHRVVKIDPKAKSIDVHHLRENRTFTVEYDKLVIGTGASPVIPPLPGRELTGVYTLRTIPDTDAIRQKVDQGAKRAVIVGGGYIGLELAENLQRRGLQVTLIEMQAQPAPNYDEEAGRQIRSVLEKHGVQVLVETKVEEILGTAQDGVTAVKAAGREHPADLVVLAVGIRPNVQLAQAAGITLGPTGAIAVNEYLETSESDIYAAGDCCETIHRITGKPVWMPLGDLANQQGRVLGENITGGRKAYKGVLGTNIFRVFELGVASTGLTEKAAQNEGYDYEAVIVPQMDKPGYMPEAKKVVLKMLADKRSRRVLGAQAWGEGAVDKAIDTIAAAMYMNATVDDFIQFDLAYAPPFAPALGLPIVAANVLENKLNIAVEGLLPRRVRQKAEAHEDFVFLDVRKPQELKQLCLPNSVNIPVQELAERCYELNPEQEIITSCAAGLRAARACRILSNAGFSNVKYMDGGIQLWSEPVPGPAQEKAPPS